MFNRLDLIIYDKIAFPYARPAPAEIIIVAVDEQSILELGDWPWSRRRHAEVIRWLSEAGAKVVALDFLFAEPDRSDPMGDDALTKAIADSGRVVLPVAMEQLRVQGQPIEIVPLPAFVRAAAALGHTDIKIDPDGRVRTVYLRAGVGEAVWVSLPQAMLNIAAGQTNASRESSPDTRTSLNPFALLRDDPVLVPFAGPAGHFRQVSYVDLLRDRIDRRRFKDALVLVGVTSTTVGSRFSVPTMRSGQLMAGVEINANLLEALRQNLIVRPMSAAGQALLTTALVLITAVLFATALPSAWSTSAAAPMAVVAVFAVMLIDVLLLTEFKLWFGPAAAAFGVALCFLIGVWRGLSGQNRDFVRRIEQTRGLLQWVRDGVVVVDAAARIEYLDAVAVQVANASAEELIGKAIDGVFVFELADSRQPIEVRYLLSSIERSDTPLTVSLTVTSRNQASVRLRAYLVISGDNTAPGKRAVLVLSEVAGPRKPSPAERSRPRRSALTRSSDRKAFTSCLSS